MQTQQEEIWKDVPGYEGRYQFSNQNRFKRLNCNFLSKTKKPYSYKEKILKVYTQRGYSVVTVSVNNKNKKFLLHRLIAKAFIPNPENKPFINHINGIKNDNRIENLEWCTPKENSLHAVNVLKQISKKRLFTEKQIKYIRQNAILGKDGTNGNGNIKKLCVMFNTNQSTIYNIITYKTYKNF